MQSVSRRLSEWHVDQPGMRVKKTISAAAETARRDKRSFWNWRAPWVLGLAAASVLTCALLVVLVASQARIVHETLSVAKIVPNSAPESRGRLPYSSNFADELAPRSAAKISLGAKPAAPAPLIVRTAQITLSTADVTRARATLENILKRCGGHIGELTVDSPVDSGRTLHATLRVPASQLDAALAEIRNLGRVESEQQGGEEVTQQVINLDARLANSRNTEQQLDDILRHRTGKITDVLEVEKEIDRVRGEIERMEAERKNLGDRIDFATLQVWINEGYKAHLDQSAPSTLAGLRNAAIEGYRNAADSLTSIALFLLSYAPVVILWGLVVFFPARHAWRRLRSRS